MANKKTNQDLKNKKLCDGCSDCCKYVALEIDKPENNDDFENLIWHLYHKNVHIYIGWDNKWYLEFMTPCKELDSKGLCKVYEKRPKICSDYKQENCTKYNKEPAEKKYFKTAGDLKKYLEIKNKKFFKNKIK